MNQLIFSSHFIAFWLRAFRKSAVQLLRHNYFPVNVKTNSEPTFALTVSDHYTVTIRSYSCLAALLKFIKAAVQISRAQFDQYLCFTMQMFSMYLCVRVLTGICAFFQPWMSSCRMKHETSLLIFCIHTECILQKMWGSFESIKVWQLPLKTAVFKVYFTTVVQYLLFLSLTVFNKNSHALLRIC